MIHQALFLSPFLIGFGISVALLFALDYVIRRCESAGISIAKSLRRLGGGAVIFATLGAVFLDANLVLTEQIWGLIMGSIAILVFGLWDDMMKLGWKVQLMFQGSLACALFVFGFRIFSIPVPFAGQVSLETIPWGAFLGFLILVAWVIVIINALNWVCLLYTSRCV